MPVPKTAVDEDYLLPGKEYEVWMAGQRLAVESKAEPEPVHEPAHHHLGLGVLVSDSAHPLTTLLRTQRVHAIVRHRQPVAPPEV